MFVGVCWVGWWWFWCCIGWLVVGGGLIWWFVWRVWYCLEGIGILNILWWCVWFLDLYGWWVYWWVGGLFWICIMFGWIEWYNLMFCGRWCWCLVVYVGMRKCVFVFVVCLVGGLFGWCWLCLVCIFVVDREFLVWLFYSWIGCWIVW